METNFFEPTLPPVNAVGKPMDRVDGRAKVMGAARYSAEYPVNGLVHGVLKTSDIAKGKITNIDTSAAAKEPGVISILTYQNIPKPAKVPSALKEEKKWQAAQSYLPMQDAEIHYAGEPVALVVADTLERAIQAAALIKVSYQVEKPIDSYHDPKADLFDPQKIQNGKTDGHKVRGNPETAYASAPVKHEATYVHAINHHNPMEPAATTAVWEGSDRLTVYESTQNITMSQGSLANLLGIPRDQIRIVTHHLGGGFGCKGSFWPHTILTVLAARAVNRPLRLVLTRPQMYTSVGHREDQEQTLKIGATQEGKLVSMIHEKKSTTSPWDNYAESNSKVVNMLYACPNFSARYELARANVMTSVWMRAPGEAPGSFALESSMDDLAHQLNMDPLQFRLLNYADKDYSDNEKPWSSKSLKECYTRGAELFGWSKRNPKPGQTRRGKKLVGMGMATATYPVHSAQGTARVRLFADGHAVVQSGATDLGTGTWTVMTQVGADALGLPPEKVRFELGDTRLPTAPGSGGSQAAGTVSSSIMAAAEDLWKKVIDMAVGDKKSPLYKAKPTDVKVELGRMFLKKNPQKGETLVAALSRSGMTDIEGMAMGKYGSGYEEKHFAAAGGAAGSPEEPGGKNEKGEEKKPSGHSMHSFGAHFCEVEVDPDFGTIRVTRWVGVHGVGQVLNLKTATSQLYGGAIFGIGSALMEETFRDPNYARYTNHNLAEYHIPVNADIPDMKIEFVPEKDPYINALGVKGIGEIGIVGVAAAVANAVYNATGKRMRSLPMTPDKMLQALRTSA
ncbi:xanthine dehydrogenase family protein molybdopterin-binding subunit [Hymenobacter defluvii]|uniref:Xanthine dehydrogenase family protein molybdopterin-binding subunit n=1 Tax=Hymenobacter defluvii TaxID=2054411 RepID=A0ABS3T625_9BACT|nr:xanthine dehydrogenase family protein molybdopterin-binding subunit [Hymenobacter defluvii]MBO3269086.1 xanthine dehydrogenase family protein molybdopterin-binding subunit [Hymenobacter defluvii]